MNHSCIDFAVILGIVVIFLCHLVYVLLFYSQNPENITTLQTLLLARSPVFAAMFAGDLAQKKERPVIEVDDVDPDAFKEMLR